ncbi:hypothetical protein BDZ94DRAFT_612764 [Collybia nuda]|uniref:Uncharacterized protein n=1 Tax=Collybia nuda TaxID=64659 RepID=A0A9P6CK57_9AGAR|nr:hypothetical protein BDZ94DRAFT_612764 [Collybia nuda]
MSQAETLESARTTADREKTTPLRADFGAKYETTPSSTRTTMSDDVDNEILPPLHFSFRWTSILLYFAFLVFFNVVIPVLLYYLLRQVTGITTKELIGISSAALGLSSCFDAPFRLYRLVRFRRMYGPIGSDVWWHLDFVMWTYTFALLVFAIPLAIAPAIAFYDFFLMSTMMLISSIGLVFFYSLLGFKLFCRCSSDPKGTPMKPAVFYTIEDMGSVDFKNGRDFRAQLHKRYAASLPFQRLMIHLTLYWTLQSVIYAAITAAVTWGSPLDFAFGWVLGQLFLWMGVSAFGCWLLVKRGRAEEKRWWAEKLAGDTRRREKARETNREGSESGWERMKEEA